jgi:tetratricopeptide (TPR) repeat protein
VLITLLGAVSSGIGVYVFVEQKVIAARPPLAMSGDLNIAVARFSAFDDQGRRVAGQTAQALADSTFRHLQPALGPLRAAGFDVQTRSPAATGNINAWSVDGRARQLQALAERARADIVVCAQLISGEARTRIVPELFINERKLSNAEEFGGYHQLGMQLLTGGPDTNPVLQRELRGQFLARARGIGRLLVGLGFYSLGSSDVARYRAAADAFSAAAQDWTDPEGQKLLDLLLGNTEGKLADTVSHGKVADARDHYKLAEQHYKDALVIDPGYGRARLGLAELTYQRARGSCAPDAMNAAGLRAAARSYQAVRDALSTAPQPPGADLPAKVAFGLGRTYVCLSQAAAADLWAQAQTELRKVIAEFRGGNQRIRVLAAEAYGQLGLTDLPVVHGAPDATERYQQAVGDFLRAIQLVPDGPQKAAFLENLGYTYKQLGDTTSACNAYRQAGALDSGHAAHYAAERRQLPGCG